MCGLTTFLKYRYRKSSNINRTFVGNEFARHSDVVGASTVGAAPTINLHSRLNTWLQWIGQRQLKDETRNIQVLGFGATYIRGLAVYFIIIFIYYYSANWVLVTHIYVSELGHNCFKFWLVACWASNTCRNPCLDSYHFDSSERQWNLIQKAKRFFRMLQWVIHMYDNITCYCIWNTKGFSWKNIIFKTNCKVPLPALNLWLLCALVLALVSAEYNTW